jgi:DNA-binding transcriptional LysR family regulator
VKYVDLRGISLFQMETCVTVARYRNITKAAEALHTSQPALSKKISQIEEQLGVALFIRGKNTYLRPTPAGQYLCAEWDRLLDEFRSSFDSAAEIQKCKREHIVVATTPSAQISLFITPVVVDFRQCYPNVELRVDNCAISDAKDRLYSGLADVVLVNPFLSDLFDNEELKWQMVAVCPLSIGMLKTNPLARKESLTVEDLQTQQFVLTQNATYIRQITDLCEAHGFTPTVSYYSKFFHGISMCIGTNNEIFFTDRFLQSYHNENCAYFDLPHTKSGIMMAVRRHETNTYVGKFTETVLRILCQSEMAALSE